MNSLFFLKKKKKKKKTVDFAKLAPAAYLDMRTSSLGIVRQGASPQQCFVSPSLPRKGAVVPVRLFTYAPTHG